MKIKILTLISMTLFGVLTLSTTLSLPSYAATSCDNARFITMPAWYRGLTKEAGGGCEIDITQAGNDENKGGSIGPAIYLIALNVGEMMMHIASYVAIAFVFVGGYRFMISSANADVNARARKTIINALVGLAVSMLAIGIINLLFDRLTK